MNYTHSQHAFLPDWRPAFPVAYGRIGPRVLAMMLDRPEAFFFVVNAGGHSRYFPVQNPAWNLELKLQHYEVGRPFGLRGRLFYKQWTGTDEIMQRYRKWIASM